MEQANTGRIIAKVEKDKTSGKVVQRQKSKRFSARMNIAQGHWICLDINQRIVQCLICVLQRVGTRVEARV